MTIALTATVAPTGNALFDGLMSSLRWAVPALTYSFPSSDGQFDCVYDGVYTVGTSVYRDVTMISLAQREYTRLVLEGIATDGTRGGVGVEQLTNLSFAEINAFGQGENSAAGEIRLTQSSLPPATAATPGSARRRRANSTTCATPYRATTRRRPSSMSLAMRSG